MSKKKPPPRPSCRIGDLLPEIVEGYRSIPLDPEQADRLETVLAETAAARDDLRRRWQDAHAALAGAAMHPDQQLAYATEAEALRLRPYEFLRDLGILDRPVSPRADSLAALVEDCQTMRWGLEFLLRTNPRLGELAPAGLARLDAIECRLRRLAERAGLAPPEPAAEVLSVRAAIRWLTRLIRWADNPAPASTISQAGEPEPLILNPLQREILVLLDGAAFKTDILARRLGKDRSALYRDGLRDLQQRGLVRNNARLGGHYRVDAPPPR